MIFKSEVQHWTELCCPDCGADVPYEIIEELFGNPDGLTFDCECGCELDIGSCSFMVSITNIHQFHINPHKSIQNLYIFHNLL